MSEKKINFEEELKRLDEIVAKIEGNLLPLDESIKLYEEGSKIIAKLEEVLKQSEEKLKDIKIIENKEK